MKWRWYPVGGVCKRQWPYRHLAAEPVRRARAIVPRGCCRLGTAGLLLQHAAADCWRASAGAWLITWQNVGTWKCKTGWHCTIHQRHLPVVCSSKPTTMKAKKCLLALRTEAWHYMPASWLSLRGKGVFDSDGPWQWYIFGANIWKHFSCTVINKKCTSNTVCWVVVKILLIK